MSEPRASGHGRAGARVRLGAALLALLLVAAGAAHLLRASAERTLFEADSEFGGVRVAERRGGVRALYTGGGSALQSAVVPGRPRDLQVEYTRVGVIGLALVPPDAEILYVGLGGGAMPMHARHVLPGASIAAVEIDPLVVEVARRFFGVHEDARLRVHVGDGRAFLESAHGAHWDLIVLDAFAGNEVPLSLATREFLETVAARLAPGGVVVANLWTRAPVYDAMLATYHAVFPDVHLVRVGRRAQDILVARSGPGSLSRDSLLAAAATLARRSHPGFDLEARVRRGHRPAPVPTAAVLRDPR